MKSKLFVLLIATLGLVGCSASPSPTSNGSNEPGNPSSSTNDDVTYVTATFVVGEGVDSIPSQTVVLGEKFVKPHDPEKEEYTFGGWFTDDSYSSLFNFDVSYTTDQTIYAKWDRITYEYYLYGRLNDVDVFLPSDYKQEQYRLSTPHEDDSDAIKAIYNFHFMPDDEIHVIRFGSDGNEKIYDLDDSEEYGRGYYDLLLYENGISLRFIRHDEWIIKFLNENDAGDTYGSFTKKSTEGDYVYFELKDLEVTANQRLFLSYAWEFNPNYYFGIMCENEWPVTNNEPWVKTIYISSALYPNAETTVYEFQKAAKYDVTVCVRKDCTYNDGNMKVTFSLIDGSESIINENGTYNLRLIKEIMTNWITKDNQFDTDILDLKRGAVFNDIKLIDPQKMEFYILGFSTAYQKMTICKLKVTDEDFLLDMSSKNITSKEMFIERLFALTARKISTDGITNNIDIFRIDDGIAEADVIIRTTNLLKKVNSEADVLFAYETASEGSDLTYGAGYGYHSVAYTSDSKLHVFSVSCLSKEHVLNDTDKYGVVSDNVTNIYEQNLEFYQNA